MIFKTSEAVSFAETVPAGEERVLQYQTDGPATIERLKLRFYPGQQLALAVTPLIREKGSGATKRVVQTPGQDTFTGDDDVYDFNLSKPIANDEVLEMKVVNSDPDYAYDFRVNAEVDYRAGAEALAAKIGGIV